MGGGRVVGSGLSSNSGACVALFDEISHSTPQRSDWHIPLPHHNALIPLQLLPSASVGSGGLILAIPLHVHATPPWHLPRHLPRKYSLRLKIDHKDSKAIPTLRIGLDDPPRFPLVASGKRLSATQATSPSPRRRSRHTASPMPSSPPASGWILILPEGLIISS